MMLRVQKAQNSPDIAESRRSVYTAQTSELKRVETNFQAFIENSQAVQQIRRRMDRQQKNQERFPEKEETKVSKAAKGRAKRSP
jgi:hypothetical protein